LHVVGDGETAMRFPRRTYDFAGMVRSSRLGLSWVNGVRVKGCPQVKRV